VAFDATDFADGECYIYAGDVIPRLTYDHCNARACVGGTADDLLDTFVGVHFADAKPVGVGVLFGFYHFAQSERAESVCWIRDLFDL